MANSQMTIRVKVRRVKVSRVQAWVMLGLFVTLLSCASSVNETKPKFNQQIEKILQQYSNKEYSSTEKANQDNPPVVTEFSQASVANSSMADSQFETEVERNLGKKLSIPKVGASESPRNDEMHDNQNDAIVVLQNPVNAMQDFPRDRRHQVDWVKALDQGLIKPRANLTGEDEMVTMDMDILMKNTQFMPWVKFPHIAHTKWLACENCHPKIFIPQENANPISMNKVLRGEYCGVCHDKVAFALFICERCHSVPHEGSGPKWW